LSQPKKGVLNTPFLFTYNHLSAFPTVVGVGAFGKFGTYPEDSMHKTAESNRKSHNGEYFAANFSISATT
jgi:hypothetical protein